MEWPMLTAILAYITWQVLCTVTEGAGVKKPWLLHDADMRRWRLNEFPIDIKPRCDQGIFLKTTRGTLSTIFSVNGSSIHTSSLKTDVWIIISYLNVASNVNYLFIQDIFDWSRCSLVVRKKVVCDFETQFHFKAFMLWLYLRVIE
jgi:hypothetical protein